MKIVEDVEQWVRQTGQTEESKDANKRSVITMDYCQQVFEDINAKFEEFERNQRLQEGL